MRAAPARRTAPGTLLLPLCLGVLVASAAHAETYAVLAVDAEANPKGKPTAAASAVRAALTEQGVELLSIEATRARLAQPRGLAGYDVVGVKKRLDNAEEANAALDPLRSVKILQAVVDDLARDPDFTVEKQKLLEDARLRLATRLVAIAGARETGAAETEEGRRASDALLEALRANPTLTLDEARFPPKMRKLLQRTGDSLKKLGLGPLTVTSRPVGASVYLEGREVGKTPLKLTQVIPQGRYRVWAELAGTRSVTQHIEIADTTPELFIDLQFEGALWPDGPGLKPLAQTTLDEDVAKKVGRFVDVDKLLLVGISAYDDGEWLYAAAFSVRSASISRRGAVRVDPQTDLAAAAAELAIFMSTGSGSGNVRAEPVPRQVLPPQPQPAAGTAQAAPDGTPSGGSVLVLEGAAAEQPPTLGDASFPWVAVGIGAGVVGALLVAGGVTTAVLVATAPRDGVVTGRFEVLE